MKDGATHGHLRELPKGHGLNPLSDSDLEEKFRQLYEPLNLGWRPREVLDRLWAADLLADVTDLVDPICPKP